MRLFIAIILFIPILLFSTTYYVSDQGSNGNNGLTLTTAWLTVDYAASTATSPGDIILIFTGDEFRETVTMDASGSDGSPITISRVDSATGLTGANAVGDKPIINGADLVTTWVVVGGGVYYNLGISTEPNLVLLDDAIGTLAANSAAVDAQDEWFWTGSPDTLFIYTTTAADTSNIQAAQRTPIIDDNNQDYITVEYLTVQNSNGVGVFSDGDNNTWDNLTVLNHPTSGINSDGNSTTISNGTWTYNLIGIDALSGNTTTIESNDVSLSITTSENVGIKTLGINQVIRYNWVHDLSNGTDDGIIINSDKSEFYYNIVSNVGDNGIDIASADSVNVFNNVTYSIGDKAVTVNGVATDNVFRNNVFDGVSHDLFLASNNDSNNVGSNNVFVNTSGASGTGSGEYTGTNDLANTDPLFIDAANDDFHLQSISPALDAGTDLSLSSDFEGNTPDDPPEIGAYEYVNVGHRWYVSNTGDDDNPGTISLPWLTVDHVTNSTFNPGNTISLNKGDEWRETGTISSSGDSDSSITINSYGTGADPIINGADIFTTWEDTGDSAWFKDGITTECKIVVYDGVLLTEAAGKRDTLNINEWDWNLDTLWVRVGEDPDTGVLEAAQRDHCITDNNEDYLVISYLHCVNANSEGINNNGDNSIIEYCTVDRPYVYGIDVKGTNTIVRYNTVTGGRDASTIGIYSDGPGHNVHNNTVKHFRVNIQVDNDSYANYSNLTHDNVCDSSDAGDISGSDGIKLTGITTQSCSVYDNTITGFGDGGIDGTSCDSLTIYGNDISNLLAGGFDGVGIEGGGAGADGWVVRDNYIHDLSGAVGNNGISIEGTDAYAHHDSIYYNIFANLAGDGIVFWDNVDTCYVLNNTFYGITKSAIITGGTAGIDNVFRNNILDGTDADMTLGANWTGVGSNNIFVNDADAVGDGTYTGTNDLANTDPLFTDAANDDFTLQSTSPAVNTGYDWGQTRDYANNALFGSAWDIGAYESSVDDTDTDTGYENKYDKIPDYWRFKRY